MKVQALLETNVATKYPQLRAALKAYLIGAVEHEVRAAMEDGGSDMEDDDGEPLTTPPNAYYDTAWDNTVDETTNHILEIGDDDLQDAYEAAGGEEGVPSHDEYALVDGLKQEVIDEVRKRVEG